jgi:DNA helicase-2/ATP-dependent DNA helicase PcrA
MALAAPSLVDFLADLVLDPPGALKSGAEGVDGSPDYLTLSTVHSAKGLEWPVVLIVSAVDGRFPSLYVRSESDAEEELRLMYVAATRARDELVILAPLSAAPMGEDEPKASRFLLGMKADLVVVTDRGREVDPEGPLARNEASAARRQGYRGPFSGPVGGSIPPKTKTRPIPARTRPAANVPEVGQRVKHPLYGAGRVVKVAGESAFIDFEQFGRKRVMITFANLSPLDG